MLRSKIAAGALLVAVLITGFASAQDQGERGPRGGGRGFRGFGGPGMGGGKVMLVGIPEVQKELNVNDDQKKQLEEFTSEAREQMQSAFGNFNFQEFQDLSEEERAKRMEERMKTVREQTKQLEEKLAKILDEKQIERLDQLQLQREGINALTREEFAKKLEITEEQQVKIRKVLEENRPRGPFGGFDPNQSDEERRAAMQRMREQREKIQADVMAVLTDEQKTKWNELKGKEFDFPQGRGGGPGFGGPGGPGRGEGRQRPRRSENGDNNGNSSETKDSEADKSSDSSN